MLSFLEALLGMLRRISFFSRCLIALSLLSFSLPFVAASSWCVVPLGGAKAMRLQPSDHSPLPVGLVTLQKIHSRVTSTFSLLLDNLRTGLVSALSTAPGLYSKMTPPKYLFFCEGLLSLLERNVIVIPSL